MANIFPPSRVPMCSQPDVSGPGHVCTPVVAKSDHNIGVAFTEKRDWAGVGRIYAPAFLFAAVELEPIP